MQGVGYQMSFCKANCRLFISIFISAVNFCLNILYLSVVAQTLAFTAMSAMLHYVLAYICDVEQKRDYSHSHG